MSFAYPLGLLGLLGIPALILIYIIKSKYTEQVIPSTYLWELSEKFLKRKRPVSKVTGIISLILQIIIVLAISITIAQPSFVLPNSAREYCFILDGTGSMHAETDNETRFDRAKDEIKSLIKSSRSGSNYALVFIGDTTYSVFENINDKKSAEILIDDLKCTWSNTDCAEAVAEAQKCFEKNSSTKIYFVTDKAYEESENIEVIDVSKNEENYAIVNYSVRKQFDKETEKAGYLLEGSLISYQSDATLTVELYVNGEDVPTDSLDVPVKKNMKTAFSFMCTVSEYRSFELRIKNTDSFMRDNSVFFYETAAGDELPTLLVGDSPSYLRYALTAIGNTQLDVMSTQDYEDYYASYKRGEADLYGLYIFDCYTPKELPKGATVWLINPTASVPKSGFSFQKVVDADEDKNMDVSEDGIYYYEASYTEYPQNSTEEKVFMQNLLKQQKVTVHKYAKYAVGSGFTSILELNSNPLIFAGMNENGDKQVVVSFNLSDTNFTGQINCLILMRNLYRYSSPSVLDETMFETGDTLSVNVLHGCTALVLRAPSGARISLPTASSVSETQLTESGVYELTATVNDKERVYSLYAGVSESESHSVATGSVSVVGTPTSEYADGFYDDILPYLIILAVIFILDWGVYCYEQYQLR